MVPGKSVEKASFQFAGGVMETGGVTGGDGATGTDGAEADGATETGGVTETACWAAATAVGGTAVSAAAHRTIPMTRKATEAMIAPRARGRLPLSATAL